MPIMQTSGEPLMTSEKVIEDYITAYPFDEKKATTVLPLVIVEKDEDIPDPIPQGDENVYVTRRTFNTLHDMGEERGVSFDHVVNAILDLMIHEKVAELDADAGQDPEPGRTE